VQLEERQARLTELLRTQWKVVYGYAYRMTFDEGRAAAVVDETFLRAYLKLEKIEGVESERGWLLRICHHVLDQSLPRAAEIDFESLDEVLPDPTKRNQPVPSLTDPEHGYLLWTPEQGCLNAVLSCLLPEERAAFTLAHVLKLEDEEGASATGIGKSAFKVQVSRAQRKVTDHLTSRCGHLRKDNTCQCPADVGPNGGRSVPLSSDGDGVPFSKLPRLDTGPLIEDGPARDVQMMYSRLPLPRSPNGLLDGLLAKVDDGTWDALLKSEQREAASSA